MINFWNYEKIALSDIEIQIIENVVVSYFGIKSPMHSFYRIMYKNLNASNYTSNKYLLVIMQSTLKLSNR